MSIESMSSHRRRAPLMLALAFGAVLHGAGVVQAQTGVVAGTVTNATTGAPVTTGLVVLCDEPQINCYNSAVNGAGAYSQTVVAGTYFAYTRDTTLADEIFDDVVCALGCDLSIAVRFGTAIVVPSGGKLVRNFALRPFGTITGTVRDAATRAGIPDLRLRVQALVGSNVYLRDAITNAAGVFTIPSLGPATYFVYTNQPAPATHVNEIFGNVLCPKFCDFSVALSGTPVVVSSGAVTTGVDLLLDRGAEISGTVRLAPIAGGQSPDLRVHLHTRIGDSLVTVDSVAPDQTGAYRFSGLAPGTYFVSTDNAVFLDEVYNDRPCAARCQSSEIASGQAVTVAMGGTVSNIDFDLGTGGSLSGTLTQAGTNALLSGEVAVHRRDGQTVTLAGSATVTNGVFTVRGLTTGTYVVSASASGHATEFFGGLQCLFCGLNEFVLSATPVNVTSGLQTQGVNVVLDREVTISGTVRRSPSNAPAGGIAVRLSIAGLSETRGVTTDALGAYSFTRLPAGAYFIATAADDLANEVYDDVPCPGGSCSPAFASANGVPVTAPAGATVSAIDFTLGPPAGVPGAPSTFAVTNVPGGMLLTWRAAGAGGAPTAYLFEAGLTTGTTFLSLPVGAPSLFVPGAPPGTYFVRVRGVNAAGTGAASAELTLRVGAGGFAAPDAPFQNLSLVSAGRLSATWIPSLTGPVPSSFLYEVGSATGRSDIAIVPAGAPRFRFDGVPPGYYFTRARAVANGVVGPPSPEIVMVAGNVAAPPSPPTNLTSQVSGRTVTLRWIASSFGPVTSYVLEAGTAPGLSNIAVFNTGSAATSLVVPGVPPGTYHLRLRAVNGQGASPPSFERLLVVP